MLSIRKLKALARKNLLGNYCLAIGASLLAYIIPGVLLAMAFFALSFAAKAGNVFNTMGTPDTLLVVAGSLVFSALIIFAVITHIFLKYGITKLYINLCRGGRYGLSNVFYAFTPGAHPWRVVGVEILKAVFQVIPVIIFLAAARLHPALMPWGGVENAAGVACSAVMAVMAVLFLYVVSAVYLSDLVVIDEPSCGIMGSIRKANEIMSGHRLKGLWFIFISFIFWKILIHVCSPAALWVVPYMACARVMFYLSAEGGLELKGDEVLEGSYEETASADHQETASTVTDEIKMADAEYKSREEEAAAAENEASAKESSSPAALEAMAPAAAGTAGPAPEKAAGAPAGGEELSALEEAAEEETFQAVEEIGKADEEEAAPAAEGAPSSEGPQDESGNGVKETSDEEADKIKEQ